MNLREVAYKKDADIWDFFVKSMQNSTNYHQYGWRSVVEKSFGHRAHYLAVENYNKKVCGVLPLISIKSAMFGSFLVSLPFFNYGGLLCNEPMAVSALLEKARSLLRESSAEYLELRNLDNHHDSLVTKQHKVTMVLDLENDEEAQWMALNAKVRNQVRKAEKTGLTAIIGHLELLDGFYDVFCRNMRDLGTPVYGKDFFQNILETFPRSTRIISVIFKGKTIASGLLTWFKETLEVPWASSIREHRDKCPNNLLYWEAIMFAIRNGSKKFDFGRSTPGEGTYRFKQQWGAKPVQLYWQYMVEPGKNIPELNPDNPKFRMAIKVWQKLPVALTKVVGPRIVRSIP